jgi:putative ABC transport system permease protein
MIKNYFHIAWRNLMKHQVISFINLFGLTLGLTCCLLIAAYILNELSYDRYNHQAKDIYRIERKFINTSTGAVSLELGAVAPPFARLLKNEYPEVKAVTCLLPAGSTPVQYDDKMFNEPDVYFADDQLFKVFDFTVTNGNAITALTEPFSVMMSEKTAQKYFGNSDPVNKVIRLNNQLDCKVTGIFKELPSASHWHPQLMISYNTLNDPAIYGAKNLETNFGNNSFYTYLLLPDNYDVKKMEAQFPSFQDRNVPPQGKYKASQFSILTLHPLTDIHLHGHSDEEIEVNGDVTRVYIFSAIALLILLIA